MEREHFGRTHLYGDLGAPQVPRKAGIPPPLQRPGWEPWPALRAPRPRPWPRRPRGFKCAARPGKRRLAGSEVRSHCPLPGGRGQSGPARSGEFADSGQSTRTGSGRRWRRTEEAQWERLTDTGNCHSACAERPCGQSAHAQRSGVRLGPRRVRRGKVSRLGLCWPFRSGVTNKPAGMWWRRSVGVLLLP